MSLKKEKKINKEPSGQLFEHGAHFKYMDLFKSLVDLVSVLPSQRLGNNGVYFQDDEDRQNILKKETIQKIRSNKTLLHITLPKAMRQSPMKYTPKNTSTTIKFGELRMNCGFKMNTKLRKIKPQKETKKSVVLPKIALPQNNVSLFNKYKLFCKVRPDRYRDSINHCQTITMKPKMKLSVY